MSDRSNQDEPTMEEILASIRKIISEDEPAEAEAAEEAVEEAAADTVIVRHNLAEDEEPPLELTRMVEEDGTIVDLRPQDQQPEPEVEAGTEEPKVARHDPAPSRTHEGLAPPGTAMSGVGAISWLNDALETKPQGPVAGASADKTIEALVREIITPHLKAWLDAHLPDLVERIVRDEVKKNVKAPDYR